MIKTAGIMFERLKNIAHRGKQLKGGCFSSSQPMMALTGLFTLVLVFFVQPPWLNEFVKTPTWLIQLMSENLPGKVHECMEMVFGEQPVRISVE